MEVRRLKRGDDLYNSIVDAGGQCPEYSASVVTCVGSLLKCRVRLAGATADHSDILEIDGPLEIVSLTGTIACGKAHIHISVSDAQGLVKGGHLMPGSIVDTTAELVLIGTAQYGVILRREHDTDTGFTELTVTKTDMS